MIGVGVGIDPWLLFTRVEAAEAALRRSCLQMSTFVLTPKWLGINTADDAISANVPFVTQKLQAIK